MVSISDIIQATKRQTVNAATATMSSSDVRDVLNLPDGASSTGGRPSKKARLSAPRPNLKGLAREVYSLGGDNPIAIVPEVSSFKKKRLANRKPAAKWELTPFKNSARDDQTLVLRHWRRKKDGPGQELAKEPPEQTETQGDDTSGVKEETQTAEAEAPAAGEVEDSAFAKFNVKVNIPTYTDDQYKQYLVSEVWSREETDYLMEVVTDFELRWPLIWDRYEWNPPATNGEANADGDESKAIVPTTQARTMEDLKARYYEVAAKVMAIQKPVQYMSQQEFALHETMAKFDPEREKARKDFARNALARSKEEAREEESLLLEVKRILARSERFNEERRELYHRLDYPGTVEDITPYKSSTGLQALLNQLVQTDKAKKRRSLMGTEGQGAPVNPAAAQAAAQESSRRESMSSQTTAQPPTAAGNKKGQQQQLERPKLTEKEEAIYGVVHFDRLGSGPIFRSEKINKLFSHKSNQQQQRIYNALSELDVPQKLAMPTASTTAQYEQLIAAVNTLIDTRKVVDRLDAELKTEEAKQGLIEAKLNPQAGGDQGKEHAAQDKAVASTEQAGAGEEKGLWQAEDGEAKATAEDTVNDNGPEPDAGDDDNTGAGGQKEEEKAVRPKSSSGAPKRSASVLSTTSDKSTKRQKK